MVDVEVRGSGFGAGADLMGMMGCGKYVRRWGGDEKGWIMEGTVESLALAIDEEMDCLAGKQCFNYRFLIWVKYPCKSKVYKTSCTLSKCRSFI